MHDDVPGLLDALHRHDVTGAVTEVRAAIDRGVAASVLVGAIAAVQRQVGERWLTGAISVAEEHLASAAADAAIWEIERAVGATGNGRRAVVVAAEGEWHALPARLVSCLVGVAGYGTVTLTPSLPAGDLQRFLEERHADVLVVSCSTVAALPGVARSVAAGHGVGVPVVVGGAAFDVLPDTTAAAIGADGHGSDPIAVLASLPGGGRRSPSELDHASVMALDGVHEAIAADAAARVAVPPQAATVMGEAAGYLVGFARAALLLRDPTLLPRSAPWLTTFLEARGQQPEAVHELRQGVLAAAERRLDDCEPLHHVLGA